MGMSTTGQTGGFDAQRKPFTQPTGGAGTGLPAPGPYMPPWTGVSVSPLPGDTPPGATQPPNDSMPEPIGQQPTVPQDPVGYTPPPTTSMPPLQSPRRLPPQPPKYSPYQPPKQAPTQPVLVGGGGLVMPGGNMYERKKGGGGLAFGNPGEPAFGPVGPVFTPSPIPATPTPRATGWDVTRPQPSPAPPQGGGTGGGGFTDDRPDRGPLAPPAVHKPRYTIPDSGTTKNTGSYINPNRTSSGPAWRR